MQGQSPYMILTNHPELNISVSTLYHYIDMGILLSRNVDLKRKVKFKQCKCHNTQITNREVFTGRTYIDFKDYHADEMEYWESFTNFPSRRFLIKGYFFVSLSTSSSSFTYPTSLRNASAFYGHLCFLNGRRIIIQ